MYNNDMNLETNRGDDMLNPWILAIETNNPNNYKRQKILMAQNAANISTNYNQKYFKTVCPYMTKVWIIRL